MAKTRDWYYNTSTNKFEGKGFLTAVILVGLFYGIYNLIEGNKENSKNLILNLIAIPFMIFGPMLDWVANIELPFEWLNK